MTQKVKDFILFVAATVGNFISATIGRMAGSHIAKPVTKLANTVKPIIKSTWEKINDDNNSENVTLKAE